MATQDKCCTIVPYFKVSDSKLQAFRVLCKEFVAKTQNEPKCLYYGFSFDGDQVHCREGYADAQGLFSNSHFGRALAGLRFGRRVREAAQHENEQRVPTVEA